MNDFFFFAFLFNFLLVSVIILGVWVGWLFVFGVLYIYIYRDTLVVLGLAVCCLFVCLFTRGVVITGLYIIIMRFCFVFALLFLFLFIVGVLVERHFGGYLGGFFSFLLSESIGGSVEKHCITCIISSLSSPSPSSHGAVENVFIHFLFIFTSCGFFHSKSGMLLLRVGIGN